MAYNIISCSGFTSPAWEATGWLAESDCLKGRIGLVLLFFLIAVIRKWGGEEIGFDFSFFLALAGGLGSYLLLITIFGNFKIALVVGIVIALVLGYGGGLFGLGGEGGYE